MKRAMLFIDGTNLFQVVSSFRKSGDNFKIDMELLRSCLCQPSDFGIQIEPMSIIRTFFYDAMPPKQPLPAERLRFFEKLNQLGITTKVLPLKLITVREEPLSERLIDTRTGLAMSLDILEHAYRGAYEVLVLVTHDDEFCDVAKRVADTGRNVYLGAFASLLRGKLRYSCDAVLDLDRVKHKIGLVPK